MSIYGKSDPAILREIGDRLKTRRLNKNITQQELARLSGLSRSTISEIEGGKPFGVLALIQVLRALETLEDLDAFLPDSGPSPLQLAKLKGRERRRATGTRGSSSEDSGSRDPASREQTSPGPDGQDNSRRE